MFSFELPRIMSRPNGFAIDLVLRNHAAASSYSVTVLVGKARSQTEFDDEIYRSRLAAYQRCVEAFKDKP